MTITRWPTKHTQKKMQTRQIINDIAMIRL